MLNLRACEFHGNMYLLHLNLDLRLPLIVQAGPSGHYKGQQRQHQHSTTKRHEGSCPCGGLELGSNRDRDEGSECLVNISAGK
jgi:hypothetical protein